MCSILIWVVFNGAATIDTSVTPPHIRMPNFATKEVAMAKSDDLKFGPDLGYVLDIKCESADGSG